jgi:hypothetical protein
MTDEPRTRIRDARRKPRQSVQERVRLHWKDRNGQLKSTMAEALDVSSSGISLKVDKPIECATLVNMECHALRIAGIASVRHCRRSSVNHYTVGLEFAGGMQWRAGAISPA